MAHTVIALALLAVLAAASVSAGDIPRPYYCGNPQPIPAFTPNSTTTATLRQVQIVVRHGDRTPAFDEPCWVDDTAVWDCKLTQFQRTNLQPDLTSIVNDRLFRKTYIQGAEVLPGNCGLGQLTSIGHNQHIANGGHVRDAYVTREPLLPTTWLDTPEEFHLRSDDAERTQESGQALFTGLYPDTGLPAGSATPVIPFYVEDEDTDTLTYNAKRCPALNQIQAVIQNSTAFQKHLKTVTTPIAAAATKAFGLPVPLGWNAGGINTKLDCLMTHVCHDFAMPDTVTDELFNLIVNEDTWQYNYHLAWPGFAKLAVGTFVGEIWANMQAVMDPSSTSVPARKFWLYAGHDDGPQMPMLAAFKVYNNLWTPYASLIAFELRNVTVTTADSVTSGFAVRMIYQGNAMLIPGCSSELCPVNEFEALVKALVPTEEECQTYQPSLY